MFSDKLMICKFLYPLVDAFGKVLDLLDPTSAAYYRHIVLEEEQVNIMQQQIQKVLFDIAWKASPKLFRFHQIISFSQINLNL